MEDSSIPLHPSDHILKGAGEVGFGVSFRVKSLIVTYSYKLGFCIDLCPLPKEAYGCQVDNSDIWV